MYLIIMATRSRDQLILMEEAEMMWEIMGAHECAKDTHLVDTRESHFVENWDEQIAYDDEGQGRC